MPCFLPGKHAGTQARPCLFVSFIMYTFIFNHVSVVLCVCVCVCVCVAVCPSVCVRVCNTSSKCEHVLIAHLAPNILLVFNVMHI